MAPPKTIAERVYLRLRADILQCRLAPGDRLRLEALCGAYGVGMSPLREALSRLSSAGLVVAEGQRGFAVAGISVDDLLGLTKTRAWIETLALRLAIATGDRNWEAEIMAAAHRLSGCPITLTIGTERVANDEWQIRHRAYHVALVAVPLSVHMLRFREHLFDLADRYRRMAGRLPPSERDIAGEHATLTAATLARDTDRASRAMIEHLVNNTHQLLANDPAYAAQADSLIARLLTDIRAGIDGHAFAALAAPRVPVSL